MEFRDYFKEAIKFGESLELVENSPNPDFPELDFKKGGELYPFIYAVKDRGLTVNSSENYANYLTALNYLKLNSLFVTAYEKFLAKERAYCE